MHKYIPIHIAILFSLLLGISITAIIISVKSYDHSKYSRTLCNITIINQNEYPCPQKICNYTSSCTSLILQNKTGECNEVGSKSCYVIMKSCKNTTINILFAGRNKTITCLNYTHTISIVPCWYNGNDIKYANNIGYEWYLIYTLVVLCVLLIAYIPGVLLFMLYSKNCTT